MAGGASPWGIDGLGHEWGGGEDSILGDLVSCEESGRLLLPLTLTHGEAEENRLGAHSTETELSSHWEWRQSTARLFPSKNEQLTFNHRREKGFRSQCELALRDGLLQVRSWLGVFKSEQGTGSSGSGSRRSLCVQVPKPAHQEDGRAWWVPVEGP